MHAKQCVVCGRELPEDRYAHRRYCNVRCRVRAHRIRSDAGLPKRARPQRTEHPKKPRETPLPRTPKQNQSSGAKPAAASPKRQATSPAIPKDVWVNYQQQPIQGGKKKCRCNTEDKSLWHGPYWYAYWSEPGTGKSRSKYIGKEFEPPIEQKAMEHEHRAPPGADEWAAFRKQRR